VRIIQRPADAFFNASWVNVFIFQGVLFKVFLYHHGRAINSLCFYFALLKKDNDFKTAI